MDILNLTNKDKCDKIKEVASEDAGVFSFRITDIRQGVKNPNRVNIFVNEKFAFSLDIAQVVEFKLKVGLEVSEEDLARFKNESEFGKLYQRALEWVLVRPRSIQETKEYLSRKLKGVSSNAYKSVRPKLRSSEEVIELSGDIISRLVGKKYLDDKVFAEWYVENRFVKKGISKKRLRMELMKKGISREIIDEVLEKRNDEEEILKIITKKRSKYDDEKLISYLCRQGFSFELAQNLVRSYGKD